MKAENILFSIVGLSLLGVAGFFGYKQYLIEACIKKAMANPNNEASALAIRSLLKGLNISQLAGLLRGESIRTASGGDLHF